MAISGQSLTPSLEALVATALLRAGADTVACRLAKDLVSDVPASELVQAVARRIWDDPATRLRHARRASAAASDALREGLRRGMQVLAITDEGYPDLLKAIPDPPWRSGSTAMSVHFGNRPWGL